MRRVRLIIAAVLAGLCLYMAYRAGVFEPICRSIAEIPEGGWLFRSDPAFADTAVSASEESIPPDMDIPSETPSPAPDTSSDEPTVMPTTISGGLCIRNASSYSVDVTELMNEGLSLRLSESEPQILIIHTHSSEAYTQAGLDRYEESSDYRTQDAEHNVQRVGDELCGIFEKYGLNVIHDKGVYDYPSYTGSYDRSGEAVRSYLEKYPSISVVIDLHRDALGTNDVTFKTIATEEGVCASQIMLLAGSDDSGLEHPYWRENLKLALYLQNAVVSEYPSLMRPVQLVSYRYNQHLTRGSLILEVGSNGNTLQEALAAIRLFGEAAGKALSELIE